MLLDIADKLRDISFYQVAMTPCDYDRITAELTELATHACDAIQHVAHLACKKDATRKNLDFLDYMKAIGRHLDKARRILEQDDSFGTYALIYDGDMAQVNMHSA